MTFPSAFGSQLAAIMDVLAKAAVAEISKLVEDGTLVLRLEMCRRDVEIQELKRSLKLMEVELCKAREAVETRATEEEQEEEEEEEEEQEEQAARTQVPSTDEKEDEQHGKGIWNQRRLIHSASTGIATKTVTT
ncbi:unnamed protein product [Pleuronectes platessa]|uniref:Uncharacterized protein n=1 Tax=Pleuronectes platessa TaxID=8262 RepID=A0A9N7UA76_PLEPL|nr:unnamed protein product [Pleuronectes platessa]